MTAACFSPARPVASSPPPCWRWAPVIRADRPSTRRPPRLRRRWSTPARRCWPPCRTPARRSRPATQSPPSTTSTSASATPSSWSAPRRVDAVPVRGGPAPGISRRAQRQRRRPARRRRGIGRAPPRRGSPRRGGRPGQSGECADGRRRPGARRAARTPRRWRRRAYAGHLVRRPGEADLCPRRSCRARDVAGASTPTCRPSRWASSRMRRRRRRACR